MQIWLSGSTARFWTIRLYNKYEVIGDLFVVLLADDFLIDNELAVTANLANVLNQIAIVYELLMTEDCFWAPLIENYLEAFKTQAEFIITRRVGNELIDVQHKLQHLSYTLN